MNQVTVSPMDIAASPGRSRNPKDGKTGVKVLVFVDEVKI